MNEIPNDADFEKNVLGAMLIDPGARCVFLQSLAPDDFFSPFSRRVFLAIQKLQMLGADEISAPAVANVLNDDGLNGAFDQISKLLDFAVMPSDPDFYADKLRSYAARREMIKIADRINTSARDMHRPADEILNEIQAALSAVKLTSKTGNLLTACELAVSAVDLIEERRQGNREALGIPSGFIDLDEIITGFQPGEYYLLAARPSVGKTAFALNCMLNMARMAPAVPSLFFSLEMSSTAIGERFINILSGVNSYKTKTGRLDQGDFEKLAAAGALMARYPIHTDDSSTLDCSTLVRRARAYQRDRGVKIMFIDYLQLIDGDRRENRTNEVRAISKAIKAISKELKIPVVALSQLSRTPEKEKNRFPRLSDLRDSGSLEQDADAVIFLHRQEKTDGPPTVAAIVAKQRNGPTGTRYLRWAAEKMQFQNLERERGKQ